MTKVARVLICVCASAAVIAWAANDKWICLAALVLMFGVCSVMLWRVIDFADRNPQAALFEGAEFLAHERLQSGTKANPVLTSDSATQEPPPTQPTLMDGPVSEDDSKE